MVKKKNTPALFTLVNQLLFCLRTFILHKQNLNLQIKDAHIE